MAILEDCSDDERTSLDNAILQVLSTLEKVEKGKGMNISQIARSTGLNWKTADKVLALLIEVSIKLDGMAIDTYDLGSSKMFLMVQRIGFDALPPNIRDLYIKNEYPEPTKEQIFLVGLLLKGATSSRIALSIDNPEMAERLINREWAKQNKSGEFYLTGIGIRIARGTLKTYPELARG